MLPYSATQAKYISWRNEGIAFDQLMIGKLASVTDIAYIPLAGNTGRIGTGQGNPGTARRATAGRLHPKAVSRQKNER